MCVHSILLRFVFLIVLLVAALRSPVSALTFDQVNAPSTSAGHDMRALAWQRIGTKNVLAIGEQVVGDMLELYTASLNSSNNLKLTLRFVSPNLSQTRVNTVAWVKFANEYYLAIGGAISAPTTEIVQLYRYTEDSYGTEKLLKVGALPISVLQSSETYKLAWQYINDRAFLAAVGNFTNQGLEPIRLVELIADQYGNVSLQQRYKVPVTTTNGVATSCTWAQSAGEYYLAVGGNFTNSGGSGTESVRLYKYAQDAYGNPFLVQMFKVPNSTIGTSLSPVMSWHTIKGKNYLAVGTATNSAPSLFIFELVVDQYGNAQLVQKAASSVGFVFGNVTWNNAFGSDILTVVTSTGFPVVQLYIVTVDNADTVTMTPFLSTSGATVSGSGHDGQWYNLNNRSFFALDGSFSGGGGTQGLRLFELRSASDLAISKTVNNSFPSAGQTITFTITAINNGPAASANTVVSDTLPTGLTFMSASASQGTYDPISGIWSIGSLPSGAARTLQIVAFVNASASNTTVTNTATIFDPYIFDPYIPNDSASVVLNVPFFINSVEGGSRLSYQLFGQGASLTGIVS